MADPRTFVLIGSFQDEITPSLAKINNQLEQLKKNFANFGGKGARTASRDLGKFNAAVDGLSKTLQTQNQVLRSTIEPMRQYRREVGKTVGALKKLDEVGGRSIAIERTNKALQEQIRLMDQLRSRRGMDAPRAPRQESFGGGGGRGGRGGGGGRSTRGGGDKDYGFQGHMAEFGFAYTLGNAISQPIQNAVVSGFQIGVGMMTKPFEYFANRFGERVQDELSDLKAAGGFFSIAQRQEGEKFIKTFDQAVDFTQANNKVLAKLAASLPGSTQDYIEVSKRISDSVARTVMTDKGAAIKYAEELRRTDTGTYGLQAIEGTGAAAQQKAIQVMLGEMTKKTVLAGQGGRAGAGGQMGAYGLPQLTERMLSQDEVSMGQFQRYSAIFSDPMVMDALAREIPNINKTAKNSVDRFKALQKLYDTVLPPELVARYRRTFSGLQETFNTAIFGPETGLFGLGRKMQGLGKKMNEFGEYIDWYGKVTTNVNEAMNADLSIYDMFRDIIVNTGQVLTPIVENFTLLWDPLQKIGLDLKKAREVTAAVLRSFHGYIKGWEDFEKGLSKDTKLLFQQGGGAPLRAALSTIANLLAEVGAIGDADFSKYTKMMEDPSAKLGPILQELVDKLLDSDVAKSIGEMIGTIVGTVIAEAAKVTGLISGRIEKSNKLVSGFQKGFKDAGGEEAFANIFKDVFTGMFNVLKALFDMIPWQGKLIGMMALIAPAIIQGGSMLLAESFGKLLIGMFKSGASMLQEGGVRKRMAELIQRVFQRQSGVIPVTVRDLGAPQKALPPAKEAGGALARVSSAISPVVAKGMGAWTKFMTYMAGVGPRFVGFFKGIAGKLVILGGVITSLASLFQGKDLATSLAEGAGPVLGAALGAALIPFLGPIGPMIGSAIGGWIGSMKPVVDTLTGVLKGLFWGFEKLGSVLGPALGAFGGVLQSIGGLIVGLIPGLDHLSSSTNAMNLAFIGVKLALFPFISAINGVAAVLLLLKMGILNFDKWLNATFQGGDRQGRLQKEIDKTWAEMSKVAETQAKINQELLKPLEDKNKKGKPKTPAAAASPTSPTGPKVGYLTKNGVKGWLGTDGNWTPLATSAPKPGGKAGDPTRDALRNKAGQDIGWLWKQLTTKPAPPSKPVTKTAQEVESLNQKATKQTTATEATKTAVVAQKASLSTIQTSVSSIFALLASGGLRVQTQQQTPNIYVNGQLQKNGGLGDLPFDTTQTDPSKPSSIFQWKAKGGLGDAISSEMRMKPPGSDLVIANSSETVIPAAGGHGMMDFVEVLRSGFNAMISTYKATQQKQENVLNTIRSTLVSNQQQTNARLQKLETKFATPGMGGGGLGGAAAGGVDAFTPIAQRMGLTMTSGYRPGDPGWHGANRARDFSNGTGPTPQMMQFAQYMASTYGSNLKELIYTPLGFSIKNGQRVAPYAQGSHYNHVHVAYANGLGNPLVAPTGDLARKIDEKALGKANVKTFTAGNGEFDSGTTINGGVNVTVNGSGIDDVDTLASIIALKIGDAVADARAASLFV
jgi:uncharacterized protein YukE